MALITKDGTEVLWALFCPWVHQSQCWPEGVNWETIISWYDSFPITQASLLLLKPISQEANERLPTLSKALLLPLIPFCLLGFLNSLFIICGAQILKRSMNRSSLVSFLGDTEKQRTMAFDMTRVFCYSVLQLVFQGFKEIFSNPDQLLSAGSHFGLHSLGKPSLLPITFCHGLWNVLKNLSEFSFIKWNVLKSISFRWVS